MKLPQKLSSLSLALAFGFCASTAQAAPVSSFFVTGNNVASDENREYLINRVGASPTIVDIGDSLRGFLNMGTLNSIGPNLGGATGNNEWTAVFQVLVTGKVALGGGFFSYTFGADPDFAANICSGQAGCNSAGLPVPGVGALAVMFEDASVDANFDGAGTREGLGASALDGAFFWTLGFSGPGGTAAAGEGWTAVTLPGLGDDIANAASFSSGASGALLNAGVSCLSGATGVGNCSEILPTTLGAFGPVQFAVTGTVRGIADLTTPFQASSDTTVAFSRIPEPGTLGLLGLALAGLGVLWRRKTT